MAKLIFAYLEIYKLGRCIIPVESTIVSFARPSRTKVPPQAREGPISETGTSHPRSPVSNHPLSSIALLVALGFYCTHIPREKPKTKKKTPKFFYMRDTNTHVKQNEKNHENRLRPPTHQTKIHRLHNKCKVHKLESKFSAHRSPNLLILHSSIS